MLVAVGFGEDDVERNGRRPHLSEARNQPADKIATPWPLSHPRQAALVHVDDDDTAAGRPRAGPAQKAVVHSVVRGREKRGPVEGEKSRDEGRNNAARDNQTATGPNRIRRSIQA
jgi:hypothetical protein